MSNIYPNPYLPRVHSLYPEYPELDKVAAPFSMQVEMPANLSSSAATPISGAKRLSGSEVDLEVGVADAEVVKKKKKQEANSSAQNKLIEQFLKDPSLMCEKAEKLEQLLKGALSQEEVNAIFSGRTAPEEFMALDLIFNLLPKVENSKLAHQVFTCCFNKLPVVRKIQVLGAYSQSVLEIMMSKKDYSWSDAVFFNQQLAQLKEEVHQEQDPRFAQSAFELALYVDNLFFRLDGFSQSYHFILVAALCGDLDALAAFRIKKLGGGSLLTLLETPLSSFMSRVESPLVEASLPRDPRFAYLEIEASLPSFSPSPVSSNLRGAYVQVVQLLMDDYLRDVAITALMNGLGEDEFGTDRYLAVHLFAARANLFAALKEALNITGGLWHLPKDADLSKSPRRAVIEGYRAILEGAELPEAKRLLAVIAYYFSETSDGKEQAINTLLQLAGDQFSDDLHAGYLALFFLSGTSVNAGQLKTQLIPCWINALKDSWDDWTFIGNTDRFKWVLSFLSTPQKNEEFLKAKRFFLSDLNFLGSFCLREAICFPLVNEMLHRASEELARKNPRFTVHQRSLCELYAKLKELKDLGLPMAAQAMQQIHDAGWRLPIS